MGASEAGALKGKSVPQNEGSSHTAEKIAAERGEPPVVGSMGHDTDKVNLSGSPADHALHAELQRRMTDLEDSDKNAPRITASTLDEWLGRIRSLDEYLTAAMDTVCLLNADERDATDYYGPLKAIEATLEQACEEVTGLSIVVTNASR